MFRKCTDKFSKCSVCVPCIHCSLREEYWCSSNHIKNTQAKRPYAQERTPGRVPSLLTLRCSKSDLDMSKLLRVYTIQWIILLTAHFSMWSRTSSISGAGSLRHSMTWKSEELEPGKPIIAWRKCVSHYRTISWNAACLLQQLRVLLYGTETWTLTSQDEKALDGVYTGMLRMALNVSWEDHVRNIDLYDNLPKLLDKIRRRRMRLAGHCVQHPELTASEPILWEPSHGKRTRGRPHTTFLDTFKRDTGLNSASEIRTLMGDKDECRIDVGWRPRIVWNDINDSII